MGCLTETTVFSFVSGDLSEDARLEAERHIDQCPECRGLVADSARSLRSESGWLGETTQEGFLPRPGGEPTPPLSRGASVGRYVVDEVLGAGGMGVVYLAHDPTLGRKITIKLLRGDRSLHPGAQAELLREAQAMARLAHPNVVAVYDAGAHESAVFLAMEFVDGAPLNQWLTREKRSWREILTAFAQAGRGLEAAHRVGIIHRDFKPQNVLVGKDGRVRVTDFGLARSFDAQLLAQRREPAEAGSAADLVVSSGFSTTAGVLKGTPAYMAPEQLLGRPADTRSDQFSFCVALYEGLYGHRPFDSDNLEDLTRAVTRGAIAPPPETSAVPASIRAVLLRGLSVRAQDRYPSLRQLLNALDGKAGAEARGRRRLTRAQLLLAAAATLAVATGTSIVVLQNDRPGPSATRGQPAAERVAAPAKVVAPSKPAPPRLASDSGPARGAAQEPGSDRLTSSRGRRSGALVERHRPRVRRSAARRRAAPAASAKRPYDDTLMEPAFARPRR